MAIFIRLITTNLKRTLTLTTNNLHPHLHFLSLSTRRSIARGDDLKNAAFNANKELKAELNEWETRQAALGDYGDTFPYRLLVDFLEGIHVRGIILNELDEYSYASSREDLPPLPPLPKHLLEQNLFISPREDLLHLLTRAYQTGNLLASRTESVPALSDEEFTLQNTKIPRDDGEVVLFYGILKGCIDRGMTLKKSFIDVKLLGDLAFNATSPPDLSALMAGGDGLGGGSGEEKEVNEAEKEEKEKGGK